MNDVELKLLDIGHARIDIKISGPFTAIFAVEAEFKISHYPFYT